MKTILSTPDAPSAIGPYSQAVQVGNLLFVSGQISMDPATGALEDGGIEAQTERVMKNLAAIITAAGYTMADVVKCTCFLADMNDFPAFNGIYGRYFESEPPARECVEVARLPRDVRVEVSAICSR